MSRARGFREEFVRFGRRPRRQPRNRAAAFFIFLYRLGDFCDDRQVENDGGVVGGRGEKTESLVLNRATQSKRSPGSSLKPLATYAPALDQGLITPYSVLTDMPVFNNNGKAWPRNENRTYAGQTTIMQAVADSTNTIAVNVINKLTPQSAYNFLTEKLGFKSLSKSDIDYAPMALGGLTDGVTVREMAQGYTALANYGEYSTAVSYTKVVDANGETILSNEDNQPTQIFEHPESTPYYVNDLLTNVVENGTGKLAAIDGMYVAGKTGTTTDNKDRWFAGYTPYYVGVCWFGYDEGYGLPTLKPNPALALWSDVMDELHEGKDNKRFDEPNEDDFVEAKYCLDSGMAPSKACYSDVRGSRVATGKFYKDDVPEEECTMHKWRTNSQSLLDLTRKFPLGVTVTDEYYCFSGNNDPIGEGQRVSSPNGHYSFRRTGSTDSRTDGSNKRRRRTTTGDTTTRTDTGTDTDTETGTDTGTTTDPTETTEHVRRQIQEWWENQAG